MATTIAASETRHSFKPSFFFWVTLVMACFVFAGFGLTYWQPILRGSLAFPPIVHIHAFIFSSWMALLMVQSLLFNTKNISLHRSVGTFGIAIATGMLITSAEVTLLFGNFTRANPGPDYYGLMYLSVMAVLGFTILFCLAIRNVRRPEYHRRLILFATLPLLPGASATSAMAHRKFRCLYELHSYPYRSGSLQMKAVWYGREQCNEGGSNTCSRRRGDDRCGASGCPVAHRAVAIW